MVNPDSNAKRTFPRVKTPAALPEPLTQGLNAYGLAAAAAGVAVLACALPAEAAPICKTLSTQLFSTSTFPLNPADQPAPPFNIAQSATFTFISVTGISQPFFWNRGFFTPNSAGAKIILGDKSLPADIAFGAEIGPSQQFAKPPSYGMLFTYGKGHPYTRSQGGGTKLHHLGNLSLVQENYVGFEFSESGDVHYGWARLTVTFQKNVGKGKHTVIHILGYGYESTPNTAIAAGICTEEQQSHNGGRSASSSDSRGASLGMLALGRAVAAR
jgi:hypothetical protein